MPGRKVFALLVALAAGPWLFHSTAPGSPPARDDGCGPCQAETVSCPPAKVVVEMAPPEVVFRQPPAACAPAPCCAERCPLLRCCFGRRCAPCAAPAAPYAVPAAPAFSYAVPQAPLMTFAPVAPVTYAPVAPVSYAPVSYAPAAPAYAPVAAAPVAPVMAPALAPAYAPPAAPAFAPPAAPAAPCQSSPFGGGSASPAAHLAAMKAYHETELKERLAAMEDTRKSLQTHLALLSPETDKASASPAAGQRAPSAPSDDELRKEVTNLRVRVEAILRILDEHNSILRNHEQRLPPKK